MGYGFDGLFPGRPGVAPRTHTHQYKSKTSLDAGHTHGLSGITSPTINPGPFHVHSMEGKTTFDDGHVHGYKTITGPAIRTRPGYHVHRYSGIVSIAGRPPHIHRFSGVTAEAPDDIRH